MSLVYRTRDQIARQQLAEESGSRPIQQQPFVRRQQIQRALRGEGRFKVREKTLEYVTIFRKGDAISDSQPQIEAFVRNVKKFRLFAVDTENKDPPIFIQFGDFLGNVIMFTDLNLIPPSVREILENPMYKFIQSNVVEDMKLMENHGGIRALGWLDSQVVLHSFVDPTLTTPGIGGQSAKVGAEVRPFVYGAMNFHRRKLSDDALYHAVTDVRVPVLQVFKAAELRADVIDPPLGPNDNIFNLIWSVVNRCLSVPTYLVVHKWFQSRSVDSQWRVAEENHSSPAPYDLNDKQEIEAIAESDADFVPCPHIYQTRAEKMTMRSEEGRKRVNQNASRKQKLRKKEARDAAKK